MNCGRQIAGDPVLSIALDVPTSVAVTTAHTNGLTPELIARNSCTIIDAANNTLILFFSASHRHNEQQLSRAGAHRNSGPLNQVFKQWDSLHHKFNPAFFTAMLGLVLPQKSIHRHVSEKYLKRNSFFTRHLKARCVEHPVPFPRT